MAQAKLPLQVRKDVREYFDGPKTPCQTAFSELAGIIGLKIVCNVEWDLLWSALESTFPDKSTFVPNVVGVIIAWCKVLGSRLEDDRFAAWTEDLLSRLGSVQAVELRVEVSQVSRPTTIWSQKPVSFVIYLPRTDKFSPARAPSGFEGDLQNFFTSESTATAPRPESRSQRNNDDGWAEIDETGNEAASVRVANPSINVRPDRLPHISTLPSPDILLQSSTPYILHVTQSGAGKLVIHGTHEPSLQFLSQYLDRWIKKDHQDVRKVPLLRITLHESNFGLGLSHDCLTIEPYETHQQRRGIEMNPAIILVLIENVLGYRCLPGVSAGYWEFRRDVPFE